MITQTSKEDEWADWVWSTVQEDTFVACTKLFKCRLSNTHQLLFISVSQPFTSILINNCI